MDRQRKKKQVWALAGALVLLYGTPAFAQGSGQRDNRREQFKAKMEDRIQRMHKELGLSPEQQKKLKAHRQRKDQMRQGIRDKMRATRQALKRELQKPNYDRQKVDALHAEIKQLMNKSHDDRLNSIIYVREVLTPEQYKAFMDKKDKFREKRGGFKGGDDW